MPRSDTDQSLFSNASHVSQQCDAACQTPTHFSRTVGQDDGAQWLFSSANTKASQHDTKAAAAAAASAAAAAADENVIENVHVTDRSRRDERAVSDLI